MAEDPDASAIRPFSSPAARVRSRIALSGRSKARKSPRPRTFETTAGNSSGHLAQPGEHVVPHGPRVLDEVLLLDDLEVLRAADHVREVSAPRRVDARRDLEDVVGHVVDAPVGREAADLRLLAEDEEVRLDGQLLPAPHRTGQADARLHFVEDEEELELVGQAAQAAEELRAEMVVSSFSLDRLEDERRDVALGLGAGFPDLELDPPFGGLGLAQDLGRDREAQPGAGEAGPVENREVLGLAGIGRVRQGEGVAGAPVKGIAEVEDLLPLLARAPREVLADLPVERGLQRVFHPRGAPLDEEDVGGVGRGIARRVKVSTNSA